MKHPVIEVANLQYVYGSKPALRDVSFAVCDREIFGVLGPNGGGKSTLFRILSTFLPPQTGTVKIAGNHLREDLRRTRESVGVVFQANSLDRQLTVWENLRCQGQLYGMKGESLKSRAFALLQRFGMAQNAGEYVGRLSGGQARRVEIVKAMLHQPQVLLLDEPSSGLDPAVRLDLWSVLKEIRDRDGVTVLLTTHFMEEAERCDRLAILDNGTIATQGTPDELRRSVGGDVVTIRARESDALSKIIAEEYNIHAGHLNGYLRMEVQDGMEWLPRFLARYRSEIQSVAVGKPTLEDAFIHHTGHRLE